MISKSDIKYIFRQLVKSPGFILLSITVLAGSLGLSLFTFTLSYIIAYKPLELPNGETIAALCSGRGLGSCLPLKAYEFAEIRGGITQLEDVGIYQER